MIAIARPIYEPSHQVAFSAFRLADGRRAGFCWDEKPRCVNGHRIDEHDAPVTEGITRCMHREQRGGPPCGLRLYLCRLPFATGERAYLVVEITRSLILAMKGRPLLELERLSILRCVLPGVEIDLAAGAPGLTSEE